MNHTSYRYAEVADNCFQEVATRVEDEPSIPELIHMGILAALISIATKD